MPDYNNTGILSRNERRRDDKDPSHQGSAEIDGKHYWISAWVNEGKPGSKVAGKKYFSLKFKLKDPPKTEAQTPARAATPAPATEPATSPIDDEGVPF